MFIDFWTCLTCIVFPFNSFKYLDSDEDLIKSKQKIEYLETVVNYLDRTLKIIGGRDWQIRNSIEWRKFTSGAI